MLHADSVSLRQHSSVSWLQRAPRACLQRDAYVSIRQHTSAYVSMRAYLQRAALARIARRETLACSIRQHTSAYVSMRACCSVLHQRVEQGVQRLRCSIRQHT